MVLDTVSYQGTGKKVFTVVYGEWVYPDWNRTVPFFQGPSRLVADITFPHMHEYTTTHNSNKRQVYSKYYNHKIKEKLEHDEANVYII
jgi:hypothetical protein